MKKYDYCFLIGSFPPFYPSGGDNIIFQIAKRLKADNKSVLLLLLGDPYKKINEFTGYSVVDPNKTKRIVDRIILKLFRSIQRNKAFMPIFSILRLLSGVDYDYSFLELLDISILSKGLLKKIEIQNGIASWWGTSYILYNSGIKVARKTYLIQNQEDDISVSGDNHFLAAKSYSLDMRKIVVNEVLYDRFKNDNPQIMEVGIDTDFFKAFLPMKKREPTTILTSLRKEKYKGSKVGIETLRLIRDRYPKAKLLAFGNINPKEVPPYIKYFFRPSNVLLRELYNDSSIFIFPSIVEGMPLIPLEAMSCGCALVSTRNGGVEEYLPDDYKFLTRVNDPKDLFAAVSILIEDPTLTNSLADTCISIAQKFSYENMYHSFLQAMDN